MSNPAIEYLVRVFLTSEIANCGVHITVKSPVPLPAVSETIDGTKLLEASGVAYEGLLKMATDWRLMTAEEVAEYKEEEDD